MERRGRKQPSWEEIRDMVRDMNPDDAPEKGKGVGRNPTGMTFEGRPLPLMPPPRKTRGH